MKFAVDLHIHSCLSPCGDESMTPNNIINMAYLKELDFIAITDHNSAENCEACMKCGEERNIIVIPGMEVETLEEVHLVTLFRNLQDVLKMQDYVYDNMKDMENREDIFGEQIIMDEKDEIKGKNKRMLITATNLSLDEIFIKVSELKGICIPAHVDRDSNSIISNLGFIPEHLNINYIEFSKKCNNESFLKVNDYLKKYKFYNSSDAHYLGDILEREVFLDLKEKSIEEFFVKLSYSAN